MTELALPIGGYLAGSISFSYLVYWLVRGGDIREVGSGNAGATNVLRLVGLAPAIAVLLLDVAKGAVPVALAVELEAGPLIASATALAAVVGHVFPVYLRFRGGKGVATALGALLALAFWPAVACVVVVLLVIAWTRFVSLGSMLGVTLAPILLVVSAVDPWFAAAAGVMALLVVARHASNIRRLRAGTERRLGERVEIAR